MGVGLDVLRYVDPSLPIHEDMRFFRNHVSGLNVARLWVRTPPGAVTDPEVLRAPRSVHLRVEAVPGVSSVIGPTSLLRLRRYAAGEREALPQEPAAFAAAVADLEQLLLTEPELRAFVDVGTLANAQLTVVFERGDGPGVAALARGAGGVGPTAAEGPALRGAKLRVVGESILAGKVGASLVPTLTESFAITAVLVFAAFLAVFRSASARLLAMIPSLFAILVTFLAMRLAGASLDVATILIATTVLGTTENDQIHFFHHLHEGEDGGLEGALRHTLRVSGRPIVFATFINAAGFLALALSSFPPLSAVRDRDRRGVPARDARGLHRAAGGALDRAPRGARGSAAPDAGSPGRAVIRAARRRLRAARRRSASPHVEVVQRALHRLWFVRGPSDRARIDLFAPAPAWALGGHLRVTRTLPHLRDRSGLDGGTPHPDSAVVHLADGALPPRGLPRDRRSAATSQLASRMHDPARRARVHRRRRRADRRAPRRAPGLRAAGRPLQERGRRREGSRPRGDVAANGGAAAAGGGGPRPARGPPRAKSAGGVRARRAPGGPPPPRPTETATAAGSAGGRRRGGGSPPSRGPGGGGKRAARDAARSGRSSIGATRASFVVVGPCSIHDPPPASTTPGGCARSRTRSPTTLYLVMRVYFEKPRTSLGWKGFINDPRMDDSFRIDEGMERARRFLLDVNELGLPAGTEALDPISPQYYGDLVTWTAIGARTSESQTHREMSSGLSTPVGFKNGTDGDLDAAVNAIVSAARPHAFLGINGQGRSAIVRTRGNRYGHLVLRGGGGRPNFDTVSVALAEEALAKAKLPQTIVVDCSHANSWKKPELQPLVMRDVVQPDPRGEPVDRGLHDGELHRAGEPADDGGSRAAPVRLLRHRRLPGLGPHRRGAAGGEVAPSRHRGGAPPRRSAPRPARHRDVALRVRERLASRARRTRTASAPSSDPDRPALRRRSRSRRCRFICASRALTSVHAVLLRTRSPRWIPRPPPPCPQSRPRGPSSWRSSSTSSTSRRSSWASRRSSAS